MSEDLALSGESETSKTPPESMKERILKLESSLVLHKSKTNQTV